MPGRFFLSMFLGIAFSLSVYNYFLIRVFPPTSKRALVIMAVLGMAGAAGYFLLLDRWIAPIFSGMKLSQRRVTLIASIFLGVFVMLAGTTAWKSSPDNIIFLLPDQTVKISAPASQTIPDPEIVLVYFSTSAGEVSYDTIDYQGWTRAGNQFVLTDLSQNSFHWTGKIGQKAVLIFLRSPRGGFIEVSWDGFTETVNLYLDEEDKYLYEHDFHIPFYASREMVLFLAALNFVFALCALCLFVWRERGKITGYLSESILPSPYPVNNRPDRGSERTRTEIVQKWGVIIGVVAVAFLLRVFFLGRAYFYIDELNHLVAAKDILSGAALGSVYQRSLYTVTLPVMLFSRLFDFNLWFAKLPGVIFNVLAIIPLYLIVEKINRKAAILACILYATNPWMIAVARNIREYAYYPFYFYWVVYGMIAFIERFPHGFVVLKDWRKLLGWKYIAPALVFLFLLIYVIWIDGYSTFQVIGVVYGAFFLFLLGKLNLKDKSNILFLVGASGLAVPILVYLSTLSFVAYVPDLNPYPIRFFFPNPPQQLYYERLAVVFVLAFVASIILGMVYYRHNFIALFLAVLFLAFVIIFTLFFDRAIRPRYVIFMQFWYLPLLGIGFYALWSVVRRVFIRGPVTALLVAMLLMLTVNGRQILLPSIYDRPGFMPVTDEYQHNMEPVQALLLAEAKPDDALVGGLYGMYVYWKGRPALNLYRADGIYGIELAEYIYSIVELHDSGWIVLDSRYANQVLPPAAFEVGDKRIEYIGLLQDQLVWNWRRNP